jgi:hypothetical protein
MAASTITNSVSVNFFKDLMAGLLNMGWDVERRLSDSAADIVVKDKSSGKRLFIDIEDAQGYGELPVSTIIPIARLVKNNISDKVMLISFSNLPSLLSDRLKELNVNSLEKPSVDQVVREVGVALAS